MPAQQRLGVWDRGRATSEPVRRALELLKLAGADGPGDSAALPVGERDAKLLAIFEELFGHEVAALVRCTTCGEELEVSIPVESVRTQPLVRARGWHRIEHEAGVLEFRLPNSQDLQAIATVRGTELRRSRLLERLVRREPSLEETSANLAEELTGELAESIERHMSELDTQGEIRLELRCDVCQTTFTTLFDIGSFLWAELDGWARRTLREVHLLARGYGWSEQSILELHPKRRQMYVEMLSQ